jgi:salicylate hydroxylase
VDACERNPLITIRLNSPVSDVDISRPALRIGDGPYENADVILGADGIKSITRRKVLESENQADQGISPSSAFFLSHVLVTLAHTLYFSVTNTGQAAYRIMLTREQMSMDPDLLALLEANEVVRWIGPQRHIIVRSNC